MSRTAAAAVRASTSEPDYFALFGLPRSFAIDEADLAARYRRLQQEVHPDRFAGGSAQERRLAVQQAALINEAFQTLKDPLKRALHLLALAGVDAASESNTAMDAAFLEEQMALREALGEIEDRQTLDAFLDELSQRIGAILRDLEEAFSQGALERASEDVRKLQFIRRLKEEALSLEDEWMD